jgi:hypothetical protein
LERSLLERGLLERDMDRRRFLSLATAIASGALCRPAMAAQRLQFSELYKGAGILGLQMSEKTVALAGQPVEMAGFMAPPLKAEAEFFVLTREPLSLCPFCSSDADWPADIVVVLLRAETGFVQSNQPILVSGVLELGSKLDARTGFVSQIRLVDAEYRKLTA